MPDEGCSPVWTVVRFELARGDPRAYGEAFDLLRYAGFQVHRIPPPPERGRVPGHPLPAAVVADILQEPSVVARAVFESLLEARLGPVGVAAWHVDAGGVSRARPRV